MRTPCWALLLLFVSLSGCREVDRVRGGTMYNWYSIEEEIELGEGVMEEALRLGRQQEGIVIDGADLYARLQPIVQRVARASHYPELPWELHTMNASLPNAWCAPGGKIMVYGGLFTQSGEGFVDLSNPDELAAILGHEMAHATCRHVTYAETVRKTVWYSFLPVYLVGVVFVPGLSVVWDLSFQGGFGIWAASYSRSDEAEADRIGAEYAARAGFDPRASLQVWERAHEQYGSDFELFGSHPPNEERVQLLQEAMPELVKIYERVLTGWQPPAYTWQE